MQLDPRTIEALWELRDHIDDPYVLGDLTGWLECQEGTPPYGWPPQACENGACE